MRFNPCKHIGLSFVLEHHPFKINAQNSTPILFQFSIHPQAKFDSVVIVNVCMWEISKLEHSFFELFAYRRRRSSQGFEDPS